MKLPLHTELNFEYMRPVIRFDKNNLVLMRVVQRVHQISFDGDMERCHPSLHQRNDWMRISGPLLRQDIRSTKSKLRGASSWDEYGAVVDGNSNNLFVRNCQSRKQWRQLAIPKGSWGSGESQECSVLDCVSQDLRGMSVFGNSNSPAMHFLSP